MITDKGTTETNSMAASTKVTVEDIRDAIDIVLRNRVLEYSRYVLLPEREVLMVLDVLTRAVELLEKEEEKEVGGR